MQVVTLLLATGSMSLDGLSGCMTHDELTTRRVSFPHIDTTGHPPSPGYRGPLEDFMVHAINLTADASTGNACLISVETGDPQPDPGAQALSID